MNFDGNVLFSLEASTRTYINPRDHAGAVKLKDSALRMLMKLSKEQLLVPNLSR